MKTHAANNNEWPQLTSTSPNNTKNHKATLVDAYSPCAVCRLLGFSSFTVCRLPVSRTGIGFVTLWGLSLKSLPH